MTSDRDTTQTDLHIKSPLGEVRLKASRTLEDSFLELVRTAPSVLSDWTATQAERLTSLLGSGIQRLKLQNLQRFLSTLRSSDGAIPEDLPRLPARLLLPILRGVSEETEERIQMMWARLVLDALSTSDVHRHYLLARIAGILGNLTPTAAAALEEVAVLSRSEHGTLGQVEGLRFRDCGESWFCIEPGVSTETLYGIDAREFRTPGFREIPDDVLMEALQELVGVGLCEWLRETKDEPPMRGGVIGSVGENLRFPRYVASASYGTALRLTTLGATLLETCSDVDLGPVLPLGLLI